MKMRTKLYIIGFIILAVVIIASLSFLYAEYGFLGLYGSIILYLVGIAFIVVSHFELKRPHSRVYYEREPVYHEESHDFQRNHKHLSDAYSHALKAARYSVVHKERINRHYQQHDFINDYAYFGKKIGYKFIEV